MLAGYNLRQIPHHFGVQPKTDPLRCDMLLCNPGPSFVIITQCINILQLSTGVQPKTDPLTFWGTKIKYSAKKRLSRELLLVIHFQFINDRNNDST